MKTYATLCPCSEWSEDSFGKLWIWGLIDSQHFGVRGFKPSRMIEPATTRQSFSLAAQGPKPTLVGWGRSEDLDA
jgi:hypothetical protein